MARAAAILGGWARPARRYDASTKTGIPTTSASLRSSATCPASNSRSDAGPVFVREGDYYGQTVNQAARIADYARPGEVLVSQAVVEASELPQAAFSAIGPVELKGVTGTIQLHAALRHV